MEATAKDWLDSLCAGTCEVGTMLKGVTELLRKSPEEGWELLSIVDQYYRRGKISAPAFATLKAHLQGLLVGKSRPEVSVPMPRSRSAAAVLSTASATTPVYVESAAVAKPAPISAHARSASAAPASDVPAAAPASIAVGSVLRNRYRVLGVLGHGGTGTVFEALDLYRLDVDNGHGKVAIKVLHPNVIRRPALFTELRREFQHLQLLSHPSIVRVHEFDRDGETAFFTMEHLSGVLLSRVIAVRESAPVSRDHALAMLRDLCAAIGYAHTRGVVHGDVSPGNVFICNDGELRVLDFGSNGVATPSFASCQVLEGAVPDVRDDVYGLACIAYILFTGAHPYDELTALNARSSKLKLTRPSGLGAGQWRALSAGLNFERNDRPLDVAVWAAALNPDPSARRLPALPTVLSTAGERRLSVAWPSFAALGVFILAGGWWMSTHLDVVKLKVARLGTSRDASPSVPSTPKPALVDETAPTPDPVSVQAVAAPVVPRPAATIAPPAVLATDSARPEAASPRSAPAVIAGTPVAPVSPGARARLELTTDDVEAVPSDGLVRVMVRRTRSLRGEVSFNWWTESGTAKPGRDFTAIASHVEQIEDGRSAVNLSIPLIVDPQRRQARSFYVVIDEADPTAAVGPRTLSMITIPEPD